MAIDLLHLIPAYMPGGRLMSVSRDHYGCPLVGNVPYPPIEVASAAGLLRSRGFRVDMICADALRLDEAEVVRRVVRLDPAHLHVPLTFPSFGSDRRLIGMLRRALPGMKVLVTGPNVTSRPERVLLSAEGEPPVAEEVILGEIEPGLLDALEHPDGRGRPNRVVAVDGGLVAGPRKTAEDLRFMEVPARDLFPPGGYHLPFAVDSPSTFLETARGCAYHCSFCIANSIVYQYKMRFRPIELVFADLADVVRLGYRDLALKDLTFTVHRGRVEAFCEHILEKGYRFGWRCMSTVDRVDAGLLKLMKRAGCYQVCYGFESGNEGVLAATGKGTTVEQGRRAARLTADAGIEVAGTFMLGLSGDTEETIEQTVRFALEEPVSLAQFTPSCLIPGTPAARANGVPDDDEALEWDLLHHPGNGAGIPIERLHAIVRSAHRRFYLRPRVVVERLRALRSPTQLMVQAKAGLQVMQRLAWV